MEVVPGIHLVDGTRGGNVYLLVEDHGLTLIDAALPGSGGRILQYIKGLGRDPSELQYMVLTHSHPDHTGAIPALLKHSSMKVLVHSGDAKWVIPGSPWLFFRGQIISVPWDIPFVRKIHVNQLVADGYTIPIMGGLQVIHTPGHTPGSISLYLEDRGILFPGDVFISDGKRFTRPIPFPGFDRKSYWESLERLVDIQFDIACVGHGSPIVGGAGKMVSQMMENYFWAAPWWKIVRKLSGSRFPRDK